MTRWGILSDIHGNLPNLERALTLLRQRETESIAVLGDNLGRGDSDGCVALIRQVADVSVLGNRDLDWQDRVSAASREYVLVLPRHAQAGEIAFTHGDARLFRELSTAEIATDFRRARAWLAAHGCLTWLFGHSHRARVWTVHGDDAPVLHFDAAADPLPARVQLPTRRGHVGDAFWIVNAGSVGLPFPGTGPASTMVLDTEAGTVDILPIRE